MSPLMPEKHSKYAIFVKSDAPATSLQSCLILQNSVWHEID